MNKRINILILLVSVVLLLSGCGGLQTLEKSITEDYNFTGDNLQQVYLFIEYYYVPFKKMDDITVYLNGYELGEITKNDNIKRYEMFLDPGTYTIDINRKGVWSSSEFTVNDTSNDYHEQFIEFQYKIKLLSSKTELVQVTSVSESPGDNNVVFVDIPGDQDDEMWYGSNENQDKDEIINSDVSGEDNTAEDDIDTEDYEDNNSGISPEDLAGYYVGEQNNLDISIYSSPDGDEIGNWSYADDSGYIVAIEDGNYLLCGEYYTLVLAPKKEGGQIVVELWGETGGELWETLTMTEHYES